METHRGSKNSNELEYKHTYNTMYRGYYDQGKYVTLGQLYLLFYKTGCDSVKQFFTVTDPSGLLKP